MKNRGVLLFAFNNERMDYVRLARYCAYRVKRMWKLPVSLVTDAVLVGNDSLMFDKVITVQKSAVSNLRTYPDYNQNLSFHNADRVQALRLTPYDQTIVIDTDLIVGADTIPKLWSDQPLMLTRQAHNLNGEEVPYNLTILGRANTPMYWATILCFDKHAPVTRQFFEAWADARSFYRYYAHLFGFDWDLFRNDFAVSVAMHKINQGIVSDQYDLPYSIPTAFTDITVKDLEPMVSTLGTWTGDVHIMHKKSLLEAVCRLKGF